MTKEREQALRFWGAILLSAILIPLASYAFAKYDASNMKSARFVQDSSVIMTQDAAFKQEVRDGLRDIKAGQAAINLRLEQIQCGKRIDEGCR